MVTDILTDCASESALYCASGRTSLRAATFTGALRRAELAAITMADIERMPRGILLTLPRSKGERLGGAAVVPLPYGETDLCPVRGWIDG